MRTFQVFPRLEVSEPVQTKMMRHPIHLFAVGLMASLLCSCTLPTGPTPSAFLRNVGPGSTVTGIPDDNKGSPNGGNTRVPGVSSAGNIGNR
jgi:hypothetical protein